MCGLLNSHSSGPSPSFVVKFTGEVIKSVKNVRYEIDMKKIMSPGGTTVGLANGLVFADDKKIYSAESLKVGLFK